MIQLTLLVRTRVSSIGKTLRTPPSEGVKVPPKRAKIGHFWLQKGGQPGPPPGGPLGGPKRPKNPLFWCIQGGTLGCDTFTAGFYEEIGF